jgi:hypothetical protein
MAKKRMKIGVIRRRKSTALSLPKGKDENREVKRRGLRWGGRR